MKVLINHDFGDAFVDRIRTFPGLDVHLALTSEARNRHIADAEIIIGGVDPEEFKAARNLKWLQIVAIGFDHLTRIPGFADTNFILTNCRTAHAIPMAEHVFAVMLSFAHRVPELVHDQDHRVYDPNKYRKNYQGTMVELASTTMGILALGDIGRAVASRAHGFEMDVYGVDLRSIDPPPPGVQEVWGPDRFDEMLGLSDWLVITAPHTDATADLLDADRLQKLKDGVYIVVVSRGGIVNEDALVAGLESGRIAGAGLDAFAEEPLCRDSPLWSAPNVIISPHICADSSQMWERRRDQAVENLRRYLAGEELLNVCDKRAGF